MPAPLHDATTVDTGAGSTGTRTTGTVSHVAAGSNRIAVARIAFKPSGSTHVVSGVTYGGVAMTKLDHAVDGTGTRVELWYLLNPPTTSQACVFTLSAAANNAAFAVSSYKDVNQSTPWGAVVKANGAAAVGTPFGVSLVNTDGSLVVDAVGQRLDASAPTLTMVDATGRVQRVDRDTDATSTSDQRLAASDMPGEGTVAMTWNSSKAVQYAILAAPLLPSDADPPPPPPPPPVDAPTPDDTLDRFVDPIAGVDTTNGTGAGTKAKPWKTIGFAMMNCPAGRWIWLRAGAHPRITTTLATQKAQTVGVQPYPGEVVTVAGTQFGAAVAGFSFHAVKFTAGCLITQPQNLGLYDSEVVGASDTDVLLNFRGGGDHVTLSNLDLHSGNLGIAWQAGFAWNDMTLLNIDVHDLTYTADSPSDGMQLGRPFNTATPHQNWLIDGFHIYNVSSGAHADGIQFAGPADNVTFRNCSVFGSRGFLICPPIGSSDTTHGPTGGTMNGRGAVTNLVIENCVFGNWNDFCIRLYQCPGVKLLYNTIHLKDPPGTNDGLDIHARCQNSVGQVGGSGLPAYEPDSSLITRNIVMVGNIIRYIKLDPAELTQAQMFATKRNNLIQQTDGVYVFGTGDISGAPTYVSTASNNLRLAAGSLGIDGGETTYAPLSDADGTARGSTPDIGAYESNPVTLPPPATVDIRWGAFVV